MLIDELKQTKNIAKPLNVDKYYKKAIRLLKQNAKYGDYTCKLWIPEHVVRPLNSMLMKEKMDLVVLDEKNTIFGYKLKVYISEHLTLEEVINRPKNSFYYETIKN